MNTDGYVIAWRAWCDQGEGVLRYDSVNNIIEDLPDDGFQAMRLWYSDGTGRYISGNDFYFFYERPDGIAFCQSNESFDEIRKRYPTALIKRGYHIPDGTIKLINDEMMTSEKP